MASTASIFLCSLSRGRKTLIVKNKVALFGYLDCSMDGRVEFIREACKSGLFGLYADKIDKSGRCRLYIDEPIISIEFAGGDYEGHLLRFSVNGIQTKGPAHRIDFDIDSPFPMDMASDTDVIEVWIDNFSQKRRKPRLHIITVPLTDGDLESLRSVTYSIDGWQLRYCPWALVYHTD